MCEAPPKDAAGPYPHGSDATAPRTVNAAFPGEVPDRVR